VRHLHAILQERGFSAVALSGELSQSERNSAMQALRDGRARVCVATDVAARGIDLPDLGLVIHAELPHDSEVLQHRSGRTGRAGRKGISVLLVPLKTRFKAERLLAGAGIEPAWSGPPTAEEIHRLDQERLLASPLLSDDSGDEDLALARALLAGRSPEDIASALVRLYRSQLPAAEDIFDPGPGRPREGREPRGRAERGGRDGEGPRASPGGHPGPAGERVWFRLDIGRQNNADPRWLLPMICRRGKITKAEIGAIRIFERETKFEVAKEAAEKFAHNVRRSGDDEVRIEPLASELDSRTARPPAKRFAKGKGGFKPKEKRRSEG
jgi:ATP-dependent RNA helicase DeaD